MISLQPADLKVSIKGNVTVKTDVKQAQEGILEVCYTAPLTGEYRISLSLGAVAVPGSPFRLSCQQPRACELNSKLTRSVEDGFANERYAVQLACFDQFGSPYSGKADIHADVLDGASVLFPADVLDLGEGNHEIAFTPEISGSYNISISFDRNRILKGCPLPVKVRNDETSAAFCKLYGQGLAHGVAGQQMCFSIQGQQSFWKHMIIFWSCTLLLPHACLVTSRIAWHHHQRAYVTSAELPEPRCTSFVL